jgi:hypothetical protein
MGDGTQSGSNISYVEGKPFNGRNGEFILDSRGGTLVGTGWCYINGDFNLWNVEAWNNETPNGIRFQNGNATINNYLKFVSQGFVGDAPKYATGSLLIYSNGGSYNRNVEWGNVPGPASPGYPHHVNVEAGTTVNLGINPVAFDSLWIGGDLRLGTNYGSGTINMGGMTRPLSIGGHLISGSINASGVGTFNMNNVSVPVLIKGNLEIGANGANGSSFSMSTSLGGDAWIHGDYTRYSGSSFNPNNRAVFFIGATPASINAPSPGPEPFPFVIVDKAGSLNNTLTLNSAVNISGKFTLTSGRVITSDANLLTITNTNPDDANNGVGYTDGSPGYVDGPMRRFTQNTTDDAQRYVFPVGTLSGSTHYSKRMIMRNLHNNAGQDHFTARYYRDEPPLKPYKFFFGPDLRVISAREYWQVDRETSGSAEARIVLPYRTTDNDTWFNDNRSILAPPGNGNVAIVRGGEPGPENKIEYAFTGTGTEYSNFAPNLEALFYQLDGDVVSRNISSFSPFTFGIGFNIVLLSVQLLSFEASLQGEDGYLHWTVDDPAQLKETIVEYSTDGQRFTRLGTVSGAAGKEYAYRHSRLPAGLHYYRLKLVARDGSAKFSTVEVLALNAQQSVITGLQQNPVSGGAAMVKLYSARAQQAEAILYDMSGKMLLRQKMELAPGHNLAPVSMAILPKGMYKLHIKTRDGAEKVLSVLR